ncbi:MAG: response regulator [Bacteroidia bacterium]|nr:response regulator [Bacteroidia bacterium]
MPNNEKMSAKPIIILMAEDDEMDYEIISEALSKLKIAHQVYWVKDGEELIDYLEHKNKYQDALSSPTPDLIFLDLNMPKVSGFEALEEIKKNPVLCSIPVVILTTSSDQEDIEKSYQLGANSYIQKSLNFEDFEGVVNLVGKYWFEYVHLPSKN